MIFNGLDEAQLNLLIMVLSRGPLPQGLKIELFVQPNYDRKVKAPKQVAPLYKELNILNLCDLCTVI